MGMRGEKKSRTEQQGAVTDTASGKDKIVFDYIHSVHV